MKKKQIKSLLELKKAVLERKSVYTPNSRCYCGHTPAAWIINLPGPILLRLFESGMYLYEPRNKNGKTNTKKT